MSRRRPFYTLCVHSGRAGGADRCMRWELLRSNDGVVCMRCVYLDIDCNKMMSFRMQDINLKNVE